MLRKPAIILIVCLLFVIFSSTQAQEATETPATDDEGCSTDVSAIVDEALEMTRILCADPDLNDFCYGNAKMDAELRDPTDLVNFAEAGDSISIDEIVSLRLEALDETTGQWGVVVGTFVAVPVDPEIDAVDDGVQIVLYGDVTFDDSRILVPVVTTEHLNIRDLPQEEAWILKSARLGDELKANGRTEGAAWLRVDISETVVQYGWVRADLVTTEDDINTLPVIDPDNEDTLYGPIQAIFQNGANDSPCPGEPPSGMLIQTPEGTAKFRLYMDEIVIEFNGTLVVEAADGNFTAGVIDGDAEVIADGESCIAIDGLACSVPINDEGKATGVPSEPFTSSISLNTPVEALDDEVEIPEGREIVDGEPYEGNWMRYWDINETPTCPDGTEFSFDTESAGTITMRDDGLTWNDLRYNEISTGMYFVVYKDENEYEHLDELTVDHRPDRISGTQTITHFDSGCELIVQFHLEFVGVLSPSS
jgi:hypothetical protein